MVLIPRRYLHLVFQPVLPALLDRQAQLVLLVHPVVMVQMVQPDRRDLQVQQEVPEPQPDLTLLLPLLVLLA